MKNKEKLSGGLIANNTHEEMVKNRHAKTMAHITVDRNKWFYVAMISLICNVGQQIGWHKADKRFAENVRVAWVKMYPNGLTDTEIADVEKPVDFFMNTVDSKLKEWIKKRYSMNKATITSDYGFAHFMMSEKMKTDFMDNYKAPDIASAFKKCNDCQEINVKIRDLRMIDKEKIENTRNGQQYTAMALTTEQKLNKEGRIVSCENKITTILWKFRSIAEVANKPSELEYNPLGQEIIASDSRTDPVPIDINACKKL